MRGDISRDATPDLSIVKFGCVDCLLPTLTFELFAVLTVSRSSSASSFLHSAAYSERETADLHRNRHSNT